MTKLVLVAEDDKNLREALCKKLSSTEGIRTIEATDGLEALEFAEKHRPALILLDMMMPNVDGIGFLKTLRQTQWGKDTDVMIFSNVAEPEMVSEAMTYDVFHYHIKSEISLSEIADLVTHQLHSKDPSLDVPTALE